jgi:bacteriorhodopsin
MVMFQISDAHFQLVYDVLSFSLASMMATTLFLWMRIPAIVPKYQSAVLISGLVTFIAAYHYIRIFNSWVDAYEYPRANAGAEYPGFSAQAYPDPKLTGVPFNDAYRYMDWLLTVPLLLIEIILVMQLSPEESNRQCWRLGTLSALMILSGYKGELVLTGDLTPRWISWLISMSFFLFIVQTLLVGLSDATNSESDPKVKDLIRSAQVWTVVSWCTYPIVYVFPMMGISGPSSVVAIQLGYSCSDIISKCGVGLLIYQITNAKSKNMQAAGLAK